LERAKRYNIHFSLCFLDLDGFKKVNDEYNHAIGDQILVLITALLKNSIRKVDILARYGGDEFVILMPETSPEDARHSIERVQKLVASENFKINDQVFKITASIGIVHINDGSRISIEEVLIKADQLMYQAKSSGKNLVSSEII
jgi:diguanylate cyclase